MPMLPLPGRGHTNVAGARRPTRPTSAEGPASTPTTEAEVAAGGPTTRADTEAEAAAAARADADADAAAASQRPYACRRRRSRRRSTRRRREGVRGHFCCRPLADEGNPDVAVGRGAGCRSNVGREAGEEDKFAVDENDDDDTAA